MAFSTVALVGFATRSPLEAELRRRLAPGVRVLELPTQAQVVLEALTDARERSVVSSTAAAQVRALQLRLLFNFRARTPQGREFLPRVDLLLARDLSYNESSALAKEYEEAELFREMQADIVTQVLRRLASITL
jgi:LPS-assembly lipoprotein